MKGGLSPDLCAQQSVLFSRQTSAEALACCPHWRGLHTLSSHDRGALGERFSSRCNIRKRLLTNTLSTVC